MIQLRWAALVAFAGLLSAATSSTWDTSSSSEFLRGRLKGLSVTSEGWLQPGPAPAKEVPLNEPVLWSLIPAGEGGVYAATGHTGKVYYIDRAGKSTLLWKADQPEVFALCTDSKGRLYAGTSPNGGVYRIDEGKAVEVAHPGTKYIWALVAAADDSVFIATGDGGKIFRLDPSGKTELYFDTGQSNVTSLALGYAGHLYAGTDPNGILYDITGSAHGTALYRSSLPEIHSIAVEKNGTIFASALGGSLASRTATPANANSASNTAVVAATPTVISVSETKENGTVPIPEQNADIKIQAPKGSATSTITSAAAVPTPAYTEVSGVDKSAIYRLAPDGAADTLRTSKEENVFNLLPEGDKIWFSTDVHGRLYSLSQNHQQVLLAETGDGDANSLVRTTGGVWVGLSNPARVVLMSSETAPKPAYESPVHDITTFARWGKLSWKATAPGIIFQTRSGNTGRPDATWSDWSAPIRGEDAAPISSPKARYIQWRAEWPSSSTAQLWSVTVPFLPQNSAPVVRSISVTSVTAATPASKASNTNSASGAYTITVTDTGDASSSTSGTTTQTANRQSSTQTQLSWQADDPDNDKLIYSVSFRGEGEQNWTPLRKDLFDNTLLLDADALADGRYLFKVTASDKPSNDLRYAEEVELVSSPVLIDNTPPVINVAAAPQRNGATLDLSFAAEDKGSALRKCEYSLDAGIWQPLEASDGITDSKQENFKLQITDLKSGEHVLAIRVYDSAGNAGLARVIIK